MSFTVAAIVPNSTLQSGAVTNTVVGAGSAHAALADTSLTSYLRFAARARQDSAITRVGFPTPSLPAGARVFGVEVVATLRVATASPQLGYPVFLLWLRAEVGEALLAGQQPTPCRLPITCPRPIKETTSEWEVDYSLGVFPTGPDRRAWDITTNLASPSFDLGRDDALPVTIDMAALTLRVLYQEQPQVTVIGPVDGPDTSPPVTWQFSSPTSQEPQDGYRVAVYPKSDTELPGFVPFTDLPAYASGVSGESPDRSWWLIGDDQQWPLPDGAVITDGDWVVFVQCAARWAGGGDRFVTDIVSREWERDATPADPPPAPTLVSVWHNHPDMQVELVIEAAAGTDAVQVQHSLTGVSWTADPTKRVIPVTSGDPFTIVHRFYSTSVPNFYRVIPLAGSPLVAGPPSGTLSVTPADDRYVMRSGSNPLLDTVIEPMPADGDGGLEVVRMQQQALHRVVGVGGQTQLPIMQWGADQGDVYDLRLWFDTLNRPGLLAAFDLLSSQPEPVFWQHPDGKTLWVGIGPGGDGQPTKDRFAPLPGKPSRENWRKREVRFTQVQPPTVY